jgi:membrane protein implicated in regulation of membrane protease activity
MNWILLTGLTASFVGFAWAIVERENPHYWVFTGISRRTAAFIGGATTLLWPGAYLLILFSSTRWLLSLAILAVWHFAVLPIATVPLVLWLTRALRQAAAKESEEIERIFNTAAAAAAADDDDEDEVDEEDDDVEEIDDTDSRHRSIETDTDDERAHLYRIVNIADSIRMQHAISLQDAVRFAREYLQRHPSMIDRDELIRDVLDDRGHKCTPACLEPKEIT